MNVLSTVASLVSHLAPNGMPLEPIDVLEDKFVGMRSLPAFGTAGLYAVLVMAGFAMALGLAAARRPRLLGAARSAAFATCALIVFDLLLLAYAFVTHDFRIRYVAHYSDRTMSTPYLLTALWGGQDGSLLWWLFLLSVNTTACLVWLRNKYKELQPYVISTLMTIVMFFVIIMAFSANPFSESIAGARVDGEGLNPLLQNFYMIIHPPSLYTGFVACSVPFAFGVAALASGRLDEEWLYAVRKWMLFAWVFLSIGNTLGMLWAYEELGWGGHWAWDPVENAAFMPWLTASAFVHSIMVQERRQMLKIWNVVLIAQTFFMTIFGTFLTRSGMIASVHAFAQSNIGVYFTYFLVTIACVTASLIVLRLPELKNQIDLVASRAYRERVGPWIVKVLGLATALAFVLAWQGSKLIWVVLVAFVVVQGLVGFGMATMHRLFDGRDWWATVRRDVVVLVVLVLGLPLIGVGLLAFVATLALTRRKPLGHAPSTTGAGAIDSIVSREAAFVANNWILLAMQVFILIATTFPLISESLTGEKVTVGPAFFNRWMVPFGLALFALMGIGPLLAWRKTSTAGLRRAFRAPLIVAGAAVLVHAFVGRKLGFPATVDSDSIYPGALGTLLAKISSVVPVIATALASFNLAVIVQEYARGIAARRKAHPDEGFFTALVELVSRARRRYGGYVVHAGIVAMFLGFTGGAYKIDQEYSLHVGESVDYAGYHLTYLGPRRVNTDPAKMEVYIDLQVSKGGKDLGKMTPARFIYRRQQMPTSEVDIHKTLIEDLYIAPGSVNPETKVATIHVYVNPLEMWIWLGAVILVLGAAVATWPEAALGEVGVGAYLRTAGATVSSLALGLLLALTPARARAADQPGTSSMHAGDVDMKTPKERALFSRLLCLCGGCDRLPLSTCVCDWAESTRAELSARLAGGESVDDLADEYARVHGAAALNVPPSRGFLRAVWIVPIGLVALGAVGAVALVRRWSHRPDDGPTAPPPPKPPAAGGERDDYDQKLDAELKDLDG